MKKALLLVLICSIIFLSAGCDTKSPDKQVAEIGDFLLNQDKIVAVEIRKEQGGTPFKTVKQAFDIAEFMEMITDIPVAKLSEKQDTDFMQKGQKLTEKGIYNVSFCSENETVLGQFLIWPDGKIYNVDVESMNSNQRTISFLSVSAHTQIYQWIKELEEKEERKETSFRIEKTQEGIIIEADLPQNSGIGLVNLYNDQVIASIGYRNNENESYIALYAIDTQIGVQKEIYRNKGYADSWLSDLKFLPNGDLALQTQERILLIEQDSLRVIKEIELPADRYHYALSNDGTKIAYIKDHCLYISDIGFTEEKLLVKGRTLKGPDGYDHGGPGHPRWSGDDKRLSYILFTYEESEGFGVVNADGSDCVELKPKLFIPDFAYFYNNDEKILTGQVTFEKPRLLTYDLRTKKQVEIKIEEGWRNYTPHAKKEIIALADYTTRIDSKILIYDIKTKKSTEITPIMKDFNYIKWDQTGERIIAKSSNNKIMIIN